MRNYSHDDDVLCRMLPNPQGSTMLVFWGDNASSPGGVFMEEVAILGWIVNVRWKLSEDAWLTEFVEPILLDHETEPGDARCYVERGPKGVLRYCFRDDCQFEDYEEAVMYGRTEAVRAAAAKKAMRERIAAAKKAEALTK